MPDKQTGAVFVTGAAGGIGQAICATLLRGGRQVAGLDIDEVALGAAERHLRGLGEFAAFIADLRSFDSVRAAKTAACARFGRISALINNAGAISSPTLLKTEENDWLGDIDINLNGAWRCIKALQQDFIDAKDGAIVNIASVNGLGVFGHPGYSVAKAGLIHLTKFCAVELGKYGVRANAICPGSVKTAVWRQRQEHDPQIWNRVAEHYPSRDICSPADVAALVSFLLSPEARLMNGAVITLDGGLTAGNDKAALLFAGEDV